jgi:hypothetical protein
MTAGRPRGRRNAAAKNKNPPERVEMAVARNVVFELCREQRDAWLGGPRRSRRSSRCSSGMMTLTG